MNFTDAYDAIKYLSSLEDIIIPKQFTYFNHCTCYQDKKIVSEKNRGKVWTTLPLEEVVIKWEMSFTERNDRIRQALDYGGVEKASISYKSIPFSKNFILRVIMPKINLSQKEFDELGVDDVYKTKLRREYSGFGDYRHPKLKNGEKILIFACSTVDEVSGKRIDIFYGVREQDTIMYANIVFKELNKQSKYLPCKMPKVSKVDGQSFYNYDSNLENFDQKTYSISKSNDFSRFKRMRVVFNSKTQASVFSEFEEEYYKDIMIQLEKLEQTEIYNRKSK